MREGIIELDSREGKELGFTSDKFNGYLWVKDDDIYVTVITSLHPNRGNFRKLLDTIERRGYNIKVPTPSNRMTKILRIRGFTKQPEYNEQFEEMVEVWCR